MIETVSPPNGVTVSAPSGVLIGICEYFRVSLEDELAVSPYICLACPAQTGGRSLINNPAKPFVKAKSDLSGVQTGNNMNWSNK